VVFDRSIAANEEGGRMAGAPPKSKEYDTGDGQTALQASMTTAGTSTLKKYQAVAVGTESLWDLVKYELVVMIVAPLPGALGFFLRKALYPYFLGSMGRNVLIGKGVTVRHPKKIRLGDGVMVDDYAVLDAKGETNRGIAVGDNVLIGRNTVLSCKDGDLSIGDNANLAGNCLIQSGKSVRIGKNVLIAAYVYIVGGGGHRSSRTDVPIVQQGQIIRDVTVDDNAWIGADVTIMDGVTIGRDAIIGAGAVVTRDVPEFAVAAGIPARVLRDRRDQN
jgi:acetyltransferase-like isoleucine patch superfamily enzyme